MDKRDEMDLMGITDVRRVYDYLPYSHQRIKRILAEDYGCHLENVWQGYAGCLPPKTIHCTMTKAS